MGARLRAGKFDLAILLTNSIGTALAPVIAVDVWKTTPFMALLILAGEVIRPFAWVMLFGVIVGTFSSVFIASPVLLLIERAGRRCPP